MQAGIEFSYEHKVMGGLRHVQLHPIDGEPVVGLGTRMAGLAPGRVRFRYHLERQVELLELPVACAALFGIFQAPIQALLHHEVGTHLVVPSDGENELRAVGQVLIELGNFDDC